MGQNSQSNADRSQQVDDLLDRFDDTWHRQPIPDIAEYILPAENAQNRELLIELIKIDLEYRWRARPTESIEPGAQLP